MIDRGKASDTCLVISTGFVILFLITGKIVFIYIAVGIGLTGIFIKPLAKLITKGWLGLAEILSRIVSTIIMTLVYYLILVPIASIYKMKNKRMLDLKNPGTSMWHQREHQCQKDDLDNAW